MSTFCNFGNCLSLTVDDKHCRKHLGESHKPTELETLRAQLAQKEAVIKNLTATNKYNIKAYLTLEAQNRLMVEALIKCSDHTYWYEWAQTAKQALSAISPETLERYRLERELVNNMLLWVIENNADPNLTKVVVMNTKALEAYKEKHNA